MDAEQTFLRVHERFSRMLTPKLRTALEYIYLITAITLFCILVVMHANYVQQPGCSSELSGIETMEAQLIQIKITSEGLWSRDDSEQNAVDVPDTGHATSKIELPNMDEAGLSFLDAKFWLNWIDPSARKNKLTLKYGKTDNDLENQHESSTTSDISKPIIDEGLTKSDKVEVHSGLLLSAEEASKTAMDHFVKKWRRCVSCAWRHAMQILQNLLKLRNITGIQLNLDLPMLLRILYLDRLDSYAVQWFAKSSKTFEPTYLYTMEKGYFLLPQEAKARHGIHTVNISISAWHPCFGNRWQQLLINKVVGYDTILTNSLLSTPGQGYLYNFQSKEFYSLSYTQELPEGPAKFGDYLVTKCGVLMMSLFVFFTTTMSVSFTLRETQSRMLKFTVQLQHHARHQLPTFQLILLHVIESLVFVPIMIGILFFLFEFYEDQLLAFTVLILVWLCELFTLISVHTPIAMKFFPRFFLLYFLVFHIYFFSYGYGFSYLALSTTAAFMQHLILYFWNRFEVPALQRFLQNRRSQFQQQSDLHITSSTILASTLHITRLNTGNQGPVNRDMASGPTLRPGMNQQVPNSIRGFGLQLRLENDNPDGGGNPMQVPGQAVMQQAETSPNPGAMNSFSSMLLWVLGGASYEGLNSFLSMFRDARDRGEVYGESNRPENHATQDVQ